VQTEFKYLLWFLRKSQITTRDHRLPQPNIGITKMSLETVCGAI